MRDMLAAKPMLTKSEQALAHAIDNFLEAKTRRAAQR
jgi:hypothetical protein